MKPENIALALNAIPPPSMPERCYRFSPQHDTTSIAASQRPRDASSYSPPASLYLSQDAPVSDVPAWDASSGYDPSTLYDVSSLHNARKHDTVVITPSVKFREGSEALLQDVYASPEPSIDSTQSFYDSVPYQPPAPRAVVDVAVSSPAPSVTSTNTDRMLKTAPHLDSEMQYIPQARDTEVSTVDDTRTGRYSAVPESMSMSPLERLERDLSHIKPEGDGTIGTDTSLFRPRSSPIVTASELTLEPVDQVRFQPEPYQSTPGRGPHLKKWIQSYAPSAVNHYDQARSHIDQWGSRVANTASAWRSEAASALPNWVPKFNPTILTSRLPSRSAMSQAAKSTAGDLKSRFNSGWSRAKSELDSGVSDFQSDVWGYTDTLRSKLPSLSRWGRSRGPETGTSAVSVPTPSFATSAPPSATVTAQSTRSTHAPVRSYFSHDPAIGLRNRWNSRASRGATSGRTTLPSIGTVNTRGSRSFISKLGSAISGALSDYAEASAFDSFLRTF